MKSTMPQSLRETTRSAAWKGGQAKTRILLALTAGAMVMPTPCEAKFTWKDLLGVLCTVGGVVSGSTGNVPVGVALIGVQTAIFSSTAVIAHNPGIFTGPDVTPEGLLGVGTIPRSDTAMQAVLAMDCPDVAVAGTPAERAFIGKANIVIGLARELRTAQDPAAASNLVQQMSAALEEAATAYEALGLLNDEITQTQWDDFKLDCADGVAPTLEEDYLIACGLSTAQRAALNLDQAAQRSVIDHRIKYKPGTVLHQAAARYNRNNVGFGDLMHQPIGDVALSQPAGGDGVHLQWGAPGTGAGGVSIALPSVAAWDGYWSDLDADNALPAGAFIESSATGDALDALGATTNGPLGSWRMTKISTGKYAVSADFSALGAATVSVQVFNGSNLVYSAGGLSGTFCSVNGCVSDDHWGRPTQRPGMGGALTLRGPTEIKFQGSASVVGDRIAILPESAPTITAFTRVSITASGVPELTITNESTSAPSARPLIRWIAIGVPGVFGGCFPGFGICSINPFPTSDGAPVLLTHSNGLNLEFLTAQADAAPVFTISKEMPLDENAAHDFGFAKFKIMPGQYPVDFSQNPFGTVHLNTATEYITLERGDGGLFNINWVNDGVNVLQETEELGSWTDMPVQVAKPTGNYRTPPKRFFRVRMRD
jgi:hypothetical protein